jgi:hypothetical protein
LFCGNHKSSPVGISINYDTIVWPSQHNSYRQLRSWRGCQNRSKSADILDHPINVLLLPQPLYLYISFMSVLAILPRRLILSSHLGIIELVKSPPIRVPFPWIAVVLGLGCPDNSKDLQRTSLIPFPFFGSR